jgi:hypothetical protein
MPGDRSAGITCRTVFRITSRTICEKGWGVYTKRAFAGREAVLAYLCRYTHQVAISNSRIRVLDAETRTVTFGYKDYAKRRAAALVEPVSRAVP